MSHFVLILYSIALLSGVVLFFVLLLLNQRYRQPIIKVYGLFHVVLTLQTLYFIMESYLVVIGVKYLSILTHVSIFLDAALIIVVPLFIHHFLSIPKVDVINRFFLGLSFLSFIFHI